MMDMSEALKKAKREYRNRCTRLRIDFYGTDADIVQYLEGIQGKPSYIKGLIRADMNKKKKEGEGQ